MALRARLVAPPPEPRQVWPWHTVKSGSFSASALLVGDRRMEAETYLSSGYGIRQAIEAKPNGWTPFSQVARAWMPGRLKGIQVSREYGTPFLAATQVFDIRPIPRKWLSLERTSDVKNRFVAQGTILVTCSGSVGRPTLAYGPLENTLISHDLLRIEPLEERNRGWVYAYLHSPQTRAMATGTHYGHIIKHPETAHIDALPIPEIDDRRATNFNRQLAEILRLRNDGYRLKLDAEALFEKAVGPIKVKNWGEQGFSVKASKVFMSGRRRMDATVHNPGVAAIRKHLAKNGSGVTTVSEAGYDVWLPSRFRRIPAQDGVRLVESACLTEVNPDLTKMIADGDFGDPYRGRVKAGWILMARSGQAYGILGTAVLAENDVEDKVITDDIIRIRPTADVGFPAGYLVTALSHPLFGRPLVKSMAYGSSIPHIDVADVKSFGVVRLKGREEIEIAALAQESAKARAAADILEREVASEADLIVNRFVTHGKL
jgi:hypothetical protein